MGDDKTVNRERKLHTLVFPTEAGVTHRADSQECSLAVVLVHGAGDHSGRYGHVVRALTSRGIPVVTGDLPGAGLTQGLPGHVDSFDEYLDAVEEWVTQAAELVQCGRVVLLGHSMGGLITVRYLQERLARTPQVIAAVLSSPCLQLAVEVPGWKRGLAAVLDTATPRLRMNSGLSASLVSRSPEVVQAYEEDPHCGIPVSVRWFRELTRAMEQARAKAEQVRVPVLLMQAGQDLLVDARGAEPFFRRLPAGGKYVEYPACYHELFNEPEQGEVLQEMTEWLAQL